jgi:hypothetical protein
VVAKLLPYQITHTQGEELEVKKKSMKKVLACFTSIFPLQGRRELLYLMVSAGSEREN